MDYSQFLAPPSSAPLESRKYFRPYFNFLKEVYDKMDSEYYLAVSAKTFKRFTFSFQKKVLSRLKNKKTVVPEIKYLGAGLLVNKLKAPDDIFSSFIPPQVAEEFKSQVLGYELGIGLSGRMTDKGYLLERVELRSDSYAKGIRANDILLEINGIDIKTLSEERLKNLLFPPLDTVVRLKVLFSREQQVKEVEVKVIEFFKETLSSVPTGIPGMFYLKINQFNQKTGADFEKVMRYFLIQKMDKLIIDLRGNGGGPPLAAREIAGFFFPMNTDLFYFQRKNRPKIMLKTPPSPVQYGGRIAILIDEGSGSASELFAGTMRYYQRAILIGVPSAGKTFLKSMFDFEDKSMVILVTSIAYLFNGRRYDPAGLKPDFEVRQNVDLFKFVYKAMDTFTFK